jgi:hypothetical protein
LEEALPSTTSLLVTVRPQEFYPAKTESAWPTILLNIENSGQQDLLLDLSNPAVFGWQIDGLGGGSGGGKTPPNSHVVLAGGETRLSAYDCPDALRGAAPARYSFRSVGPGK